MKIPLIIKLIFNENFLKLLLVLLSLIILILTFKNFLIFFFGVFFFAFLFWTLSNSISFYFQKILTHNWRKIFRFLISRNLILTFLYILFISIITFAIIDIVPVLLWETQLLLNNESLAWVPYVSDLIEWVSDWAGEFKQWIDFKSLSTENKDFLKELITQARWIWSVMIQVILALFLSYVFLIDYKNVSKYLHKIKYSNFSFIYTHYKMIALKIERWFGVIFKAQSIIAIVNTILTIWLLYIVWTLWGWFPYMITIWVIVFIAWFIPVLWTFISSVPILFIAYSIAGTEWILWTSWIITIVHVVEAYLLNPKIVSSYAKLPIALTFLILVVSEHALWVVWMLTWIPIYYILVDIFTDLDIYINSLKEKYTLQKEKLNTIHNKIKEEIKEEVKTKYKKKR